MIWRLKVAIAVFACRAGLNLNHIFDPVHTLRLGQPFRLRSSRSD